VTHNTSKIMSHHDSPPMLTSPAFELSPAAHDPASSVKSFLARRREWFERALSAGLDAVEIARESSVAIDGVVRALFERACASTGGAAGRVTALLALGGYGRKEMGLASDVDLLFLIEPGAEAHAAAITDGILYPLWDGGMEAGGATRTLTDCRSAMHHDVRALTAMMDARLIGGNQGLRAELMQLMASHFNSPAARRQFAEQKIREQQERISRAAGLGDALQPNVKDGEGGLREFQTFTWVARAAHFGETVEGLLERYIGDPGSRESVHAALRFIWAVRHALHLSQGTRTDKLSETIQADVANRLGIRSDIDGSATERFMSLYNRHARALHLNCWRGIELARRELMPRRRAAAFLRRRRLGDNIVKTEHGTLAISDAALDGGELSSLKLFVESRKRGLHLDPATKAMLSATPRRLNDMERSSPETARLLRMLFARIENLDLALTQMQECGALERWFPEMGPMLHRVQRDGFHYYTAGTHSIRAVGEIAALTHKGVRREFPMPAKALSSIKRPWVLMLATLFHDIGKGRGGDHAEKGALLARAIASRMGLAVQDVADIEFLVRSHLLMATLAFRRDVRDPALVERFARSFRSPELLAMLYLITFADLRAVGPHVWNDWKGGLLVELYERTRAQLASHGVTAESLGRDTSRLVKAIRQSLGNDEDEETIREFLTRMPERYAHSMKPDSIAAHILMSRELSASPVATLVRDVPERSCTEISIVTRDSQGLFAKIAGVLSANGANIVDAELSTTSDGIAVDVLWITDSVHKQFSDPERLARFRTELASAITGGRTIEEIVGGRFRRRLLSWSQGNMPAEVNIDNDVSATHTVVEIKSHDRRGLLYTIASTFLELGCSIDLARITTHVDRVIDVFYIRDALGKKIEGRERLDEIQTRLRDAIEE